MFCDNYLTLDADKCHLLVSVYKYEPMFAKVGDALQWEDNSVKLLGLFIDSDSSFHGHIKVICKKASQKLSAISSIFPCLHFNLQCMKNGVTPNTRRYQVRGERKKTSESLGGLKELSLTTRSEKLSRRNNNSSSLSKACRKRSAVRSQRPV